MAIKIVSLKNGPYLVSGDLSQLTVTDADGNTYDLTGKQQIALCRCGGSVNKPFCDGTHSRIGFQGAELAVKLTDGQTPPK
jgi:3-phenylpropionate/trans-cinnamate dioxygenase ferredoxin subunit